jgi:hypothetical protein
MRPGITFVRLASIELTISGIVPTRFNGQTIREAFPVTKLSEICVLISFSRYE